MNITNTLFSRIINVHKKCDLSKAQLLFSTSDNSKNNSLYDPCVLAQYRFFFGLVCVSLRKRTDKGHNMNTESWAYSL